MKRKLILLCALSLFYNNKFRALSGFSENFEETRDGWKIKKEVASTPNNYTWIILDNEHSIHNFSLQLFALPGSKIFKGSTFFYRELENEEKNAGEIQFNYKFIDNAEHPSELSLVWSVDEINFYPLYTAQGDSSDEIHEVLVDLPEETIKHPTIFIGWKFTPNESSEHLALPVIDNFSIRFFPYKISKKEIILGGKEKASVIKQNSDTSNTNATILPVFRNKLFLTQPNIFQKKLSVHQNTSETNILFKKEFKCFAALNKKLFENSP